MLLLSLSTASSLNLVRLMSAIGLRVSLRFLPPAKCCIGKLPGSGSGRKSSPVVVPMRRYFWSRMAPHRGCPLRESERGCVRGTTLSPIEASEGGSGSAGAEDGRGGVAKSKVGTGDAVGGGAAEAEVDAAPAERDELDVLLSELERVKPANVAAAIDLGVRRTGAPV